MDVAQPLWWTHYCTQKLNREQEGKQNLCMLYTGLWVKLQHVLQMLSTLMILESLLANNIFSCWPILRIAWVRRIEGHMVTSRPSHHYTIHSPHHAATTPSMASTSSPSSSLSVQVQLSKSSQVVHGGAYFLDVSSWKSIPFPIEIGVLVEEFASFVRVDLLQSCQL